MKKIYEMLVQAYTTIVVEVEEKTEEDCKTAAFEIVDDVLFLSSELEHDETSVDKELKTPEDIERAIQNSQFHSSNSMKEPYREE